MTRKDISNTLIIFESDRKKWQKKVTGKQGRRYVEVGTLLLGNDKNNIIADKVLSYF